MNSSLTNLTTYLVPTVSLIILVLVLVQLVSYAHVYKNVHRYYRATLSFDETTNTLLYVKDPYNLLEKPSTNNFVSTFTISKPGYAFSGANISAVMSSERGGVVSVTKTSDTTFTLTPIFRAFRMASPLHITGIGNYAGYITFHVPYGGLDFEVGETFTISGLSQAHDLNGNHVVYSSTPTSVVIAGGYPGDDDAGGYMTHASFSSPQTSGVIDLVVTFPQLASK